MSMALRRSVSVRFTSSPFSVHFDFDMVHLNFYDAHAYEPRIDDSGEGSLRKLLIKLALLGTSCRGGVKRLQIKCRFMSVSFFRPTCLSAC